MSVKSCLVLLIVFSLFSLRSAELSGSPACGALTDECQCEIAYHFWDGEYFEYCIIPDEGNRIPEGETIDLQNADVALADGAEYIVSNKYGEPIYTRGFEFVEFVNLVAGNTYEFKTCSREVLTYDSRWDSVLVLRDPEGNVLATNDDCGVDGYLHYCSYIAYTHSVNAKFTSVFLSIYIFQEDDYYTCTQRFDNPRMRIPVFYSVLNVEPCVEEYLECKGDVAFDVYDTDGYVSVAQQALSGMIDYSACNSNEDSPVFQVSTPGLGTQYLDNFESIIYTLLTNSCRYIGDHVFTFSFYGYTCNSVFTLRVEPRSAAPYAGTNEYWPVVLNPITENYCNFGDFPCPLHFGDNTAFPPIVIAYGGCTPPDIQFDVSVKKIYPRVNNYEYDNIITLGDLVDYEMDLYTPYDSENPFDNLVAGSVFCGIQIIKIYDTYTDEYIENSNIRLYYDNEYILEFAYYYSEDITIGGFQIGLYNGSRINYSSSFYPPSDYQLDLQPGFDSTGAELGYGAFFFTFTSDIEDSDFIEQGIYDIVIYTTYSQTSYDTSSLSSPKIYFPGTEKDTEIEDSIIETSTTRGPGPQKIMLSIANPKIHLSQFPLN